MAKISTYTPVTPGLDDLIIVTDKSASNATKNVTVRSIIDLGTGPGSIFGSVYFVTPNGNDTNGTVGDLNKPFKTITAARIKATSDALVSPLIYVYPGTYPEYELQYEGSYYFSPGVIITGPQQYYGKGGMVSIDQVNKKLVTPGNFATYFNSISKFKVVGSTGNDGIYTVVSAVDDGVNTEIEVSEAIPSAVVDGRVSTAMPIFNTGDVTTTSGNIYTHLNGITANNTKVYGECIADIPKTIDNDWAGGFVRCSQGADIYIETHSIKLGMGVCVSTVDNSILTLRGEFFEVLDSGYGMTFRDTSQSVVNFQRIKQGTSTIGGTPYCIYFRRGNTANFSGNAIIDAAELIAEGSAPIIGITDTTSPAKAWITCPDLRQTGTQIAVVGNVNVGGEFRINGTLRASNGIVFIGSSNCLYKWTGDLICTGDITSFITAGADKFYINGDIYTENSPTVTQLISLTSGELRLNGSLNIDGIGITKSGGDLILDSVKIISTGDSISAAVAQDINVIHSLASNSALNVNITNIVTGSLVTIDANVK